MTTSSEDQLQLFRDAAQLYRKRSDFQTMAEYLHRVLAQVNTDGDSWAWLGYCYLMINDVEKAHIAYQQTLYLEPAPNPHLWYGLGLLYERRGVHDLAEQYLARALEEPGDFDRHSDCTFRLGMVYKKNALYPQALQCFYRLSEQSDGVVTETVEKLQGRLDQLKADLHALQDRDIYTAENAALQGQIGSTEARILAVQSMADLWFHIGHTEELEGRYKQAKQAFEKVLEYNNTHAAVLQKLGWLYHSVSGLHSESDPNAVQKVAIKYLERSVEANATDDAAWYLLGRCCMRQKDYKKAHHAYQQAVSLNDKEPTYWCSMGVLYYYNSQYHEALDTYARALQLNPELSEIWYNLGILYECCNQLNDATDAYRTAAVLSPSKQEPRQRLIAAQQAKQAQQLQQIQTTPYYNFQNNRPGPAATSNSKSSSTSQPDGDNTYSRQNESAQESDEASSAPEISQTAQNDTSSEGASSCVADKESLQGETESRKPSINDAGPNNTGELATAQHP